MIDTLDVKFLKLMIASFNFNVRSHSAPVLTLKKLELPNLIEPTYVALRAAPRASQAKGINLSFIGYMNKIRSVTQKAVKVAYSMRVATSLRRRKDRIHMINLNLTS